MIHAAPNVLYSDHRLLTSGACDHLKVRNAFLSSPAIQRRAEFSFDRLTTKPSEHSCIQHLMVSMLQHRRRCETRRRYLKSSPHPSRQDSELESEGRKFQVSLTLSNLAELARWSFKMDDGEPVRRMKSRDGAESHFALHFVAQPSRIESSKHRTLVLPFHSSSHLSYYSRRGRSPSLGNISSRGTSRGLSDKHCVLILFVDC